MVMINMGQGRRALKAVVLLVSGAELSVDIPGASEWEAMSLVLKMAQKLPDQSVDSVYIMAEPLSVAPALKNVIAG